MKIVIAVAGHMPYWMPADAIYFPMQGGSLGKASIANWQRDDEGENISEKNFSFCELTRLYWLWKNMEADVYGIVHYRRHFASNSLFIFSPQKRIVERKNIERIIKQTDIVLPKKRRYWIETSYTQYAHAHHEADLIATKTILKEQYPSYLNAWDRVMNKKSGHRFNMFLMKKNKFFSYCDWLFGVLFELEKRLDISSYTIPQQRVFGYIAERLLDVWIEANEFSYHEMPVVHLESQHWIKKIIRFLSRKWKSI